MPWLRLRRAVGCAREILIADCCHAKTLAIWAAKHTPAIIRKEAVDVDGADTVRGCIALNRQCFHIICPSSKPCHCTFKAGVVQCELRNTTLWNRQSALIQVSRSKWFTQTLSRTVDQDNCQRSLQRISLLLIWNSRWSSVQISIRCRVSLSP
jgi:hypothetical protein